MSMKKTFYKIFVYTENNRNTFKFVKIALLDAKNPGFFKLSIKNYEQKLNAKSKNEENSMQIIEQKNTIFC